MSGHVEKEYSIPQIAMNLTAACFISGAIIATTYGLTHSTAVAASAKLEQETMQSLVAGADSFKKIEGHEDWYEADKGGQMVAYIVPSEPKGYGGAIKMLVAIDKDGKVVNYAISSMNETPGLGSNAANEPFKKQFAGLSDADLKVTKDDPSGKIQAMTGATITSRAVTKGVKAAVDEVAEFTKGAK